MKLNNDLVVGGLTNFHFFKLLHIFKASNYFGVWYFNIGTVATHFKFALVFD